MDLTTAACSLAPTDIRADVSFRERNNLLRGPCVRVLFVRNEVASARHLGQYLETAHERDEIERGMQRAAHQTFAVNGAANGDEHQCAAEPWQGASEATGEAPSSVTPELLRNPHVNL